MNASPQAPDRSSGKLEFWFGYGSTYSYLTVMRIERAIHGTGIELVWKPFNLTALMQARRLPRGPFVDRPEKLAYMWRDLERRAQRQALSYRQPAVYPVDSQRTVRVGVLAAGEGWCGQFTKKVFHLNFVDGRPIGTPGQLEAALGELDKDPEAIIRRAHSAEIEAVLERDTRLAIERGMFGSPNFLVDGELFWGDDRLEDAIDWCLSGRLGPD
jgi:2-hydroxychromene-2-carboxylate isomerase